MNIQNPQYLQYLTYFFCLKNILSRSILAVTKDEFWRHISTINQNITMDSFSHTDNQGTFIFENEGILNSVYKEETKRNYFQSHPNSVYGIKQKIRNNLIQKVRLIPALIKLSFWLIIIIILLNI